MDDPGTLSFGIALRGVVEEESKNAGGIMPDKKVISQRKWQSRGYRILNIYFGY